MYARDDAKDEEIAALRAENSVIYSAPSAASLIDNRVLKSYNFSNLTYQFGSTMQAICNSGSDFIWGPSSYLRLKYTVTAKVGAANAQDALPNLGYGSIMNLFRNVRLTTRSGEILEQVVNSNVVAQIRRLYETSHEDSQKLEGMIMGPPINVANQYNSGSRNYLTATTHVACIPLKMLFGIFDNENQFIPNTVLAGAKIELEMESPANVFANWTQFSSAVGGAAGTVVDFEPTLILDSAIIYQALQKQLLAEQSNVEDSGLSFTYSTYFCTTATQQAVGSDVGMDIQQAATLCEKVMAVARISTGQGNDTNTPGTTQSDSFQFFPAFKKYQWRLGSSYFPQQIISVPVAAAGLDDIGNGSNEVYANAIVANNSYPTQFHKSMMKGSRISMYPSPLDGIVSTTVAGTTFLALGPSFSTSAAVYATTLEKQPNGMNLTGNATNSGRVLRLDLSSGATQITTGGAATTPYQIVVCLRYIRVCHVMGDNCVVDR